MVSTKGAISMTKKEKLKKEIARLRKDLELSPSPVDYKGELILEDKLAYLEELEEKVRKK